MQANQVNMSVPGKIFIISEPKSIEAIRETFIARYPNGKVSQDDLVN